MEFNWYIFLIAALIPMITGFIWYSPKLFGNAWMQACGLTEEQLKGANMSKVFLLSYVLSILLALSLYSLTVHQSHLASIFLGTEGFGDPTSEVGMLHASIMEKYGNNFRTFKHGAFHGFLAGIFIVLPILGTNAMFERKSWKYVWINTGYWAITIMLMGGVVCQWA
ncbi:MAG: DUF1761 domain-containing protein [Bacteroidetes bacterium]|nr:MAG: DUF1761 domain-containing protein [Bacteroidota bacterium]REK00679.1 MAG: DUF1761 domain-containing protein [Bacteroidota bacterium]REK35199.1 MAG: DUF1761 domain-containing protein [Bacteroidota bacterium]REK48276.1 MAG: DUF1761 domain-containing protein [Bacteroidota bacterium]